MAMFGLPGGAEILFILIFLVVLFVPAAVMFAVGFFAGKKAGALKNAVAPRPGSSTDPQQPVQEEPSDG